MPEVEDIEIADQSNEALPKAPSVSRGSKASIEESEEKSDTRNKIIGAGDLDMDFGLDDDKDQMEKEGDELSGTDLYFNNRTNQDEREELKYQDEDEDIHAESVLTDNDRHFEKPTKRVDPQSEIEEEAAPLGQVDESADSKSKAKPKGLNAPIKKRGQRIIDDGNIDFRMAALNAEDKSQLIINCNTECDDNHKPGVTACYSYLRDVDWTDRESVAALNVWRHRIFYRSKIVGWQDRPPRWLQSEKARVLMLVQEQLDIHPGGGVKWKRLANEYNEQLKGVNQLAHEPYIYVGGDNSVLGQDRLAPWRQSVDIMAVATRWEEYKNMMALAAPAKRGIKAATGLGHGMGDSSDDEEVPNPNTPPKSKSRKRKSTSTTSEPKAKAKDVGQEQETSASSPSKERPKGTGKAKSKGKEKVEVIDLIESSSED